MKILYLTQYYSTLEEYGATRHYYHCMGLVNEGYDVELLTTFVHHKNKAIDAKYRGKLYIYEEIDGLKIHRVYCRPLTSNSKWDRLLNYLSFQFLASLVMLKTKASLVFISSPPLPLGLLGAMFKKIKGGKFIFEVRDLWPESIVHLGFIRKDSILHKFLKYIEYIIYTNADGIVALTPVIQRFIENNRHGITIAMIPNGVDDIFEKETSSTLDKDIRRVVYCGSFGKNNALDVLIDMTKYFSRDDGVIFEFVGEGDYEKFLLDEISKHKLTHVVLPGKISRIDVPEYLNGADICMLAINKSGEERGSMPNKMFDYMASGKPIIASVPECPARQAIEQAGCAIIVDSEEPELMAKALKKLLKEPGEALDKMGQRGRQYVLYNYSRKRNIRLLIDFIDDIIEEF